MDHRPSGNFERPQTRKLQGGTLAFGVKVEDALVMENGGGPAPWGWRSPQLALTNPKEPFKTGGYTHKYPPNKTIYIYKVYSIWG